MFESMINLFTSVDTVTHYNTNSEYLDEHDNIYNITIFHNNVP